MFNTVFIVVYCLLFATITWHRFQYGLFLLFLLLPMYLVRFEIFGIPTTLLEIMLLTILFVWFVKESNTNLKSKVISLKLITAKNKSLFIAITLFLLGATISIFTAVDLRAALGEWKAFYIEPFLIFLVLLCSPPMRGSWRGSSASKSTSERGPLLTSPDRGGITSFVFALVLCGLATSILAIYQHFTGWMVPWAFWENGGSYRVTGWYGFPNGVGLFLAPIVVLALYLVVRSWSNLQLRMSNVECRMIAKCKSYILVCSLLTIPCAILAIIYAKSTGAIIGVAAGIGFLLLMYKKTRPPIIILGLVSIVGLVSLDSLSSVREEIFAQDRSGQIRVSMWGEAAEFLSDNPIAGAGLASYEERIEPYHTLVHGEKIEIYHHPHNIFLTIWVNTGLVGLVGFVWMIVWYFRVGLLSCSMKHLPCNNLLPLFLLASMVTLLTTGLVDSPYIKNDLAIVFWFLFAMMVVGVYQPSEGQRPSIK